MGSAAFYVTLPALFWRWRVDLSLQKYLFLIFFCLDLILASVFLEHKDMSENVSYYLRWAL